MKQENSFVVEHRLFHGDYRLLKLAAPQIGPLVQPGQFVHMRIPRLEQAVLRRPFSIFKADAESLSILYKTVGKGTAALATVAEGEPVNLIGPLGAGFPGIGKDKTPVLVAGGYGNAALYLQAARLPVKGVAFFGGRTSGDVLCVEEFEALGWEVRIATDDGSLGQTGFVTAALDAWLAEQESGDRGQPSSPKAAPRHRGAGGGGAASFQGSEENSQPQRSCLELFACGPNAMLKAVGDRALEKGITAWLSMDRNMACGVGACLTCVIKRKTAGGWEWARCCKDGPVFNAEEILWEE